jgi:hypothetical protein
MPAVTPYRTLAPARRLALVTHDITHNRPSRDGYISRIIARGGGFRADKLRRWPPEQLAREVVRHNLETAQDELNLLVALYVELEPQLQITFLDAAGVAHDAGSIAESLPLPYADADHVRGAATALIADHGGDARRYLRTIALYNGDAWPGLAELVADDAGTAHG